MKSFIFVLLGMLLNTQIVAQNIYLEEYPYEYELRIEEVQPTYITECKAFNPSDTGLSYDNFLKTLNYTVQVELFLPRGSNLLPIYYAEVVRLFENDSTFTSSTNDSNQVTIHVIGDEPLLISIPDFGGFIGLDKIYVGCLETFALPTKFTFVYGQYQTDDIPHVMCKRKLSTKELMQLVRYAEWRLDEDEQPEVLKCKDCILYYPL